MIEAVLRFTNFLDVYINILDYKLVAGAFSVVMLFIKYKVNYLNVDWHCMFHASIVASGALLCFYIDLHASEIDEEGTPEFTRLVECKPPLTSLHKFVPMLTLGYTITDILDGIKEGKKDFVLHGICLLLLLVSLCEMDAQHALTPALIMELSNLPLNMIYDTHISPNKQFVFQVLFLVLFFATRIVLVPYLWSNLLYSYFTHEAESCFHKAFIYVIVLFGIIFHGLNFYWFTKIVRKVQRKLNGNDPHKKLENSVLPSRASSLVNKSQTSRSLC